MFYLGGGREGPNGMGVLDDVSGWVEGGKMGCQLGG